MDAAEVTSKEAIERTAPSDGERAAGRAPRAQTGPRHRITLLGGFKLEADGEPMPVPAGAQRLISLLALRGGCGRSRLAGSLWPESTEPRALANLRTAIWRANQVAPSLIRCGKDSVCLGPGAAVDVVDLVESAHSVMSAGSDALPEAFFTQYVDGDLLPDWNDEWLTADRERMRQLRLHLLEILACRLSERGQFGLALEAGMSALRADPLRESAHRAVIRIHLAEGNVAEALHAYAECRDVLARDVGVSPTAETTGLVRTVVPGRFTAATRDPDRLRPAALSG